MKVIFLFILLVVLLIVIRLQVKLEDNNNIIQALEYLEFTGSDFKVIDSLDNIYYSTSWEISQKELMTLSFLSKSYHITLITN